MSKFSGIQKYFKVIQSIQIAVADSTTVPRHAPQDKSLEMAGLVAPPQPAGAAVSDEGEPQAPDSTTDVIDDEFLDFVWRHRQHRQRLREEDAKGRERLAVKTPAC